ncbi:nadh:ubiquinone oxidoreductase subunit [Trichoderma cornu-damae]|uniref:Nadh:ubiquinone oxidoreductase subunit n=1 Tax=Trichoderma cornu-damae TaxID=654480 RepID=A0A9P8TSM8_9HYPO|nr:nadh:ubiquinone oxidoreductase subunit [Trichoderma cornu-damae]
MAHLHVKPDPALLKLEAMQKNRHRYFRFTPRTARISFLYIAVVPAIFGYVAYKTDGLYELRGKRKGDTVYEK